MWLISIDKHKFRSSLNKNYYMEMCKFKNTERDKNDNKLKSSNILEPTRM